MAFTPPPLESYVEEDAPASSRLSAVFNPPPPESLVDETPPIVKDELGIGEEVRGFGRALNRGGRRFAQTGSVLGMRKPGEIQDDLDKLRAEMAQAEKDFGADTKLPTVQTWRSRQQAKINQLEGELDYYSKMQPELAQSFSKQQAEIEKLPETTAQKEFAKETTPWYSFFKNPVELATTTLAESLPVMAQSIAAAPGGPAAVALATGMGSHSATSSGRVINAMVQDGVDTKNPEAVLAWFGNRAKSDPKIAKADLAALGPAAFDSLTAGLAGKFLGPALGQGTKPVLIATGKEMGLQMAGGGAGSIAESVIAGEPIDWKDFVLEVAGEFAPGEAAGNVMSGRKKTQGSSSSRMAAFIGPVEPMADAVERRANENPPINVEEVQVEETGAVPPVVRESTVTAPAQQAEAGVAQPNGARPRITVTLPNVVAKNLNMTFSGEQTSQVPGQPALWDFRFKEPDVQMFSVVVPAGTPEPEIARARDVKVEQLKASGDWKTASPTKPKEPSAPVATTPVASPAVVEQSPPAVARNVARDCVL